MRVRPGSRRSAGLGLALAGLLWVTAACTGSSPPGSSAAPASPSVDLSAELRAPAGRLLDQGATGAVIRVDDGHRVVQFAVGLADLKPRRDLEPGDEFRVGSTTKTFMAALVLQLVAEGRLALDDTVDRWLPGQVPNGSAITVRMLLDHSSGLPDYTNDPLLNDLRQGRAPGLRTPEQLLAMGARQTPLFAPGTAWAYSDTNYIALGLILQKVTHRSVRQLVQERISEPLGLRHTYLGSGPGFRGAPYAHGYSAPSYYAAGPVVDGLVDTTGLDLNWAWIAGGMVSTAPELATVYAAVLSARLVPPRQLQQMKATIPTSTPGVGYGLGIQQEVGPCGNRSGSTPAAFPATPASPPWATRASAPACSSSPQRSSRKRGTRPPGACSTRSSARWTTSPLQDMADSLAPGDG
jgi:D-alanyl-D-alanine carboxypeptidase